jgi:hypothetical protein
MPPGPHAVASFAATNRRVRSSKTGQMRRNRLANAAWAVIKPQHSTQPAQLVLLFIYDA